MFIPFVFYVVLIIMYLFFRLGLLVGYIKGNAIKVTKSQFQNLHSILLSQCKTLEIDNVPDMYIMQNGGILNAFATAFMGSNYIVLYSEIADEAYQDNIETVEFIIGHELGHIKRKHMLKSLLLFPSFIVPFLSSAYSRACEYTCDSIGASLSPKGVKPGLILLASGKNIWKRVNIDKFIEQESTESGFWFWFAEKTSSHPRLTKRIIQFNHIKIAKAVFFEPVLEEKVSENTNHSRYLPNN
jgi:Zn-dependent protease with chaperone function